MVDQPEDPKTKPKRKYTKNNSKNTITDVARTAFKANGSNEEVLSLIRRYFPKSRTSLQSVQVLRASLRTQDPSIPGAKEAKKARLAISSGENPVVQNPPKERLKRSGRPRIHFPMQMQDSPAPAFSRPDFPKSPAAPFPTEKSFAEQKPLVAQKPVMEPKPVAEPRPALSPLPVMPQTHIPQAQTARVIAIASDHAGVGLKEQLKQCLAKWGFVALDLGANDERSVDYPDYAQAVAQALAWGEASRGVAICGSGIGMSIAANRHRHIRAALCTDGLTARLARQHNDANVLILGSRLVGTEIAKDCLYQFLYTQYEGGRHQQRIEKMS